jgi:ribonuclease P protein component
LISQAQGSAVALTGQSRSLISRAKPCAGPEEFGFQALSRTTSSSPTVRSGDLKREADLSTEQARTQAPSRFPSAYGNQGRTESPVGASGARTQAALGLTAAKTAARIASMERLRQRADFLAAASGIKIPAAAFVLQARKRSDTGPARFGFTVSKKVGNAVERNRVRRRLREIVRLSAASRLRAGHDYVLVGRRAALNLPFALMTQDFEGALRRVHAKRSGNVESR